MKLGKCLLGDCKNKAFLSVAEYGKKLRTFHQFHDKCTTQGKKYVYYPPPPPPMTASFEDLHTFFEFVNNIFFVSSKQLVR